MWMSIQRDLYRNRLSAIRAIPSAASQRCCPKSVRVREATENRNINESAKFESDSAHFSRSPGTEPRTMRIQPITTPVMNCSKLITRMLLPSHERGIESTESTRRRLPGKLPGPADYGRHYAAARISVSAAGGCGRGGRSREPGPARPARHGAFERAMDHSGRPDRRGRDAPRGRDPG